VPAADPDLHGSFCVNVRLPRDVRSPDTIVFLPVRRIAKSLCLAVLFVLLLVVEGTGMPGAPSRPRAADLGIAPGVFPSGPLNAITDVEGVRVGHVTLDENEAHTGVTAIIPHGGNLFRERVPAAIAVGNGFGKLVGVTQVDELGELETPILLTNTLAVWDAAVAIVEHTLAQPGNEDVRSVNPIVGETNDGWLNDIRSRPLRPEHFRRAIEDASSGVVEEGSVGAGRGTRAFGFKGGIGTASRVLPAELGGHVVGVLVQSNFGGVLTMSGVELGKELGHYAFEEHAKAGDGSCMIVVATDAPLDARQLGRLARRAFAGMARTGASFSHGSGDYVIAFSTAQEARIRIDEVKDPLPGGRVGEPRLSPLFQAVAKATEEAIYNSLLRATTVEGRDGHVAEALPVDRVRALLQSGAP
jgi:D-aminopeptidase